MVCKKFAYTENISNLQFENCGCVDLEHFADFWLLF